MTYSKGPIPYMSTFNPMDVGTIGDFKFDEYSTLKKLGLHETALFSNYPVHVYFKIVEQLIQDDKIAYKQFSKKFKTHIQVKKNGK